MTIKGFEAVQVTLEQIDIVKQMARRYPADFAMAYTADDIRRIHKAGKIASLIGIEGGHQINNSLAVLRQMHDAGARYMTLTHSTNTEWADSATDAPAYQGLTDFGREVVREMNRLGMLVDLSHVSPQTMNAALDATLAPVIFSHSSARALNDHPRNVPDDVLKRVTKNRGIVMVTFATAYISTERNRWTADRAAEQARFNSPPFGGIYVRTARARGGGAGRLGQQHPKPAVTLSQVADHVEHVRQVAGVDHVGLGGDFDGMPDAPTGLEGVDRYPALFVELMRRGWSDQEIAKLAGENSLRVMARSGSRRGLVRQPDFSPITAAAIGRVARCRGTAWADERLGQRLMFVPGGESILHGAGVFCRFSSAHCVTANERGRSADAVIPPLNPFSPRSFKVNLSI